MSCFDIHAPNGGYHTAMAPSGAFLIPRPLAVDPYSPRGPAPLAAPTATISNYRIAKDHPERAELYLDSALSFPNRTPHP